MEISPRLKNICGNFATDKKSQKTLLLTAVAATTLFLAGCATTAKGTPEEQVKQRAGQQLQALQASKWKAAYNYTLPSYRAVATQEVFEKRFSGAKNWKNAEVVSVTCELDKCKVVTKIQLGALPMPGLSGNIATHVEETWLHEDGQWWLFKQL